MKTIQNRAIVINIIVGTIQEDKKRDNKACVKMFSKYIYNCGIDKHGLDKPITIKTT